MGGEVSKELFSNQQPVSGGWNPFPGVARKGSDCDRPCRGTVVPTLCAGTWPRDLVFRFGEWRSMSGHSRSTYIIISVQRGI